MRSKTLEISWHGTSPIFAADYQPWTAAQLRKVLPFPTGSVSTEGSSPGLQATTPGTPSRKPDRSQAEPNSPARPLTGTNQPLSGTVKAMANESSGSTGGYNAGAARVYRLATGGADSCVRIWTVHPNVVVGLNLDAATGREVAPHPPRAVYAASLKRHTGAVNVVRWSPNGQYLASAGDDGTIIIWHQVESRADIATFGEDEEEDKIHEKEFWKEKRMIVATKQAIYDIAWSPDGRYILAGSTDNLAQVFSVIDGSCVHQIQDHSHFVQGVAWDPLNEYLATQSSDRSVQVHSVNHRNNTLTISPLTRDRNGRSSSHMSMDIRSSRPPSFSALRPSTNRRASTASEAGSVVTLASELPEPLSNTPNSSQIPSALPGPTALLNNMNPPLNVPGSRRSSFSSAAANSPLLGATTGVRAGRSPSPAPLPAIRPSGTLPLTTQIINQKLYRDELATNFFRRLTFAPDGSLLLTPAGQIEDSYYPMPLMGDGDRIPGPKGGDGKAGEASKSTVYIYSRANLSRPPIAHLPGHQSTTVAVKFSPIFYELRNVIGPPSEPRKIIIDKKNPDVHVSLSMPPPPPPSSTDPITKEKIGAAPASMFALPYRLMYAVAAQDSVLLYDTQQTGPLAIFKGLHYSAFTDVAWSPTGDSLLLTSSDGYCSMVVFDVAELGPLHAIQQHHRQLQAIAQNYSGTFSLPPSPAPSSSLPVAYPARMEREMSITSTGAPSLAASPFTTRAELNAGIHGIPAGTASAGKPGSPMTSSVVEDTPSKGLPTKRTQSTDGSETSQKKRKIDLTSATSK